MSLLVIFGAGASYDSAPAFPPSTRPYERPPLANELFQNRPTFVEMMQKFPECQPIVPWLRDLPSGTTVEQRLEEFQADVATHPQRQRQLTAVRFYLQHMLWECQQQWANIHGGITNYKTLFDSIEHWRAQRNETVEVVTFNYDTMLEEGLSWLDLKFKRIEDYISDDHYRVFKLHGSVDWIRRVTTPFARSESLFLNNVMWGAAHDVIRNANHLRLSDITKIETVPELRG